jgi:hypothetical protein
MTPPATFPPDDERFRAIAARVAIADAMAEMLSAHHHLRVMEPDTSATKRAAIELVLESTRSTQLNDWAMAEPAGSTIPIADRNRADRIAARCDVGDAIALALAGYTDTPAARTTTRAELAAISSAYDSLKGDL